MKLSLSVVVTCAVLTACDHRKSEVSSEVKLDGQDKEFYCREEGKLAAKIIASVHGNHAQMLWLDYFENTFIGDGYDSPTLNHFSGLLQGFSKSLEFSSVAGNYPGEFTKKVTLSDGNVYVTDKNYFYLDYTEKLWDGQIISGNMQCRLKDLNCYTVQILATANRSKADESVEYLMNANMRSSISTITGNSGTTLFRVRSGDFSTEEDAQNHAQEIKDIGLSPSAWVTSCELEENILERN